jgi:predicted negative regulator of RcsB-dependent stress response
MTSAKDRARALAALAVALATLAAYGPALDAGYIWDDDQYVTGNATLLSVSGLRRIWTDPGATPQYYPLVHTSYWLEHRVFGLVPFGYHLDNVLLHLLGAFLLWRLLARLEVAGAGLAAALFAIHPVAVESVAWITERKNVLSGVFWLGAALAYLRATEPAAPRLVPVERRWYAVALALFGCALLSKSVTVTLPVAIALVVFWKRGRLEPGEWLPLVPFLAVGVVAASLTAWLEKHHVGAHGEDWSFHVLDRCVAAGKALAFYLGKLVWPRPLIFVYPRWDVRFANGWNPIWPIAAGLVIAGLFILRGRIGRGPFVVVACFAVTLAPALGFVDFYPMRFAFVADHFQYHASAVALAGGAWLFHRCATLAGPRRAAPARALAIAWLATLGVATWSQAHAYRDEATIWRDTIAKNPDAWLAQLNLGRLLARAGRLEEARAHLETAVRLKPDEAKTHSNLGSLRLLEGRVDEAVDELRQAARLEPGLADAHYNLGLAYERQGRTDAAIHSYRNALEVDPRHAGAASRLQRLLGAASPS